MIAYEINSVDELTPEIMVIIGLVVLWELVWKSIALWRAARNEDKLWFIAIIAVNSVGILPIIYLLTHKISPAKVKKS